MKKPTHSKTRPKVPETEDWHVLLPRGTAKEIRDLATKHRRTITAQLQVVIERGLTYTISDSP